MLLLFLLLVLILSIPAVQTRIGKYATDKINAEFGTNINIEAVGLQLNGDVELKNIYIEDYRKDTLVNIIELNTSILNFKKLYEGKLTFGDIDIEGLTLNIKTYKDEPQTNLDVFVARFDDDQPTDGPSSFLMSSSDVTITNGVFRMLDENKETETILDFDNIFINATNFLINGSDVSMRVNTLAFHDSRGLKMRNLTTNFKYTLEDMTFEDLNITTENSKLKGDLKFLYEREDLQYFTDKVNIEATFTESDIALNELNTFYNEFGADQRAKMQVEISGTLNNLRAKDLRLTTSSRSRIYGDISFLNLMNPAEDNFEMDGNFTNLSSNYNDLKALLPNVLGEAIPSAFAKLGNFTIKGQTHITSSDIDTNISVDTDLGRLVSNLGMTNINNIDNASYKGKIILEDFDLGTFTEDPTIGTASVNLNLDGKGFTMENINTKLQGDIFQIGYNNYLYRDLDVSGTLKNKVFNGNLISHDPNLKLDFDGLADFSHEIYKFDFIADVQHANLRALNFVKNDSLSLFNGLVEMKMDGRSVDDAVGSITFTNTVYKNENDTYEFDDFAITSSFNGNVRTIDINSPDIIEGQLSGDFKFADIGKLVENSLGNMYSNYSPHKIKTEQYINFNFKIYSKIVEVFYPDLELGPNTYIRGRLENDEKQFNLTFKSPEIKLFDYFAKDIELQVDNDNPLFNAAVEIDSVSTKFYNVSKFNLVNVTLNDTMFVRSEFNGGKNNADNFNLNFYHTVNAQNKSVIGFKTSDVTFKNNQWVINKQKDTLNKVEFDKSFKDFSISKLMMSHNNEQITLGGVLKDSTYKDLKLNFKDVDLAKITPEIDSLTLAGNVNGKLDVLQQNGVYLPNSTITIDDFEVNKIALGSFKAHIIGNESLTNYNVDITIKDEEIPSFRAYGNIDVSDEVSNVNVDVDFNNFNLEPLNPFGQDVINNIRGLASGRARVRGNLKQPTIDGNLALNKTGLLIPYLNVDMDFADGSVVELKEQSFILKDINITDTEYKTKGVLGGSIAHTNFSDWVLDLQLNTQRFLVLNTEEEDDVMYYGTGFIGGTAS
ncbi:MAG TPA: hypothetical protein VKZ97_10770, partial [Flavobacteriaceae bacterium]|nr:hypothetical protein [Flavobacteriaceae bacterium]